MFSWKNIKTTIRQKVVNGENNTEKALGVAEVIGKTIASSASAVVKVTPHVISHLMTDVINNTDDDAKRSKAQDIKDKMEERIEKNNNSSSLQDEKESEPQKEKKNHNSYGLQDKELSELQKYEEKLKDIHIKIEKYEKAEKRADARMNEIFLKLETASEEEKLALNTEKEKLFNALKEGHTNHLKLIAKESQLSRIIDDYKYDN